MTGLDKTSICAFIGQQVGCFGTMISGEHFLWGMGLTLTGIIYIAVAVQSIDV